MATNKAPATEAPQGAAQPSDTKAEVNTAKASDELSEDDLDAVAGGAWSHPTEGRDIDVTPNKG